MGRRAVVLVGNPAAPTFWESIAVGMPLVVGPGLTVMDTLIADEDLGAVAESLEPASLASATRAVVDVDPNVAAARRARSANAARQRHSWPVAAAPYLELVRRVAP